MNLTDCVSRDRDLGKVTFSTGIRVYSTVYGILVCCLIIISSLWWYLRRKTLIYLERRSFPSIFFLAAAVLANLYMSVWPSTRKSYAGLKTSCLTWNVLFCSIIPFLVIGSLVNVAKFKYKEKYTTALLKYKGEEEISNLIKMINTTWFSTLQMFVLGCLVIGVSFGISISVCKENSCAYLTTDDIYPLAVMLFFFFVAGVEVFYLHQQLKTYPDPFDILGSTYRAYIITFILTLIVLPLGSLYDKYLVDYSKPIKFSGAVLRNNLFLFFYCYLVPLQIYRAYRFNVQSSVYQEVTLEKVLDDKTGHDLFKDYLVSEFSVENIIFLDAMRKLRSLEAKRQKQFVNQVYLQLIQRRTLNLSSEVYANLFALKERNMLTGESFKAAEVEIYDFVSLDSFCRFKLSKQFQQYIGTH